MGGVGGHLWRGMSRADVKEFGELIDAGQAALVIVGESKLQEAVDKASGLTSSSLATCFSALSTRPSREAATQVS